MNLRDARPIFIGSTSIRLQLSTAGASHEKRSEPTAAGGQSPAGSDSTAGAYPVADSRGIYPVFPSCLSCIAELQSFDYIVFNKKETHHPHTVCRRATLTADCLVTLKPK